jgi:hypothetical protein
MQGRQPRNSKRETGGRRGDGFLGEGIGRIIFEALADFVLQFAEDGIQQGGGLHLDLGRVDEFFVEETGKQQAQQIAGDGGDGGLGREIFAIQMIDAAGLGVGGDQFIGQFCDRIIHPGSITEHVRQGKYRP